MEEVLDGKFNLHRASVGNGIRWAPVGKVDAGCCTGDSSCTDHSIWRFGVYLNGVERAGHARVGGFVIPWHALCVGRLLLLEITLGCAEAMTAIGVTAGGSFVIVVSVCSP